MAPGSEPKLRMDSFLWGLRWIQLVFTIAVLGVTGENASLWHSIDCSTPSKLGFNIAVAAITLPALIYFLASSGSKTSYHLLPHNQWVTLGLDAFFLIFWIAATGASIYDCNGVCKSCSAGGSEVDQGYGFTVYYGSLICSCVFEGDYDKRSLVKRMASLFEGRASGGSALVKVAEKAGQIAAKRGLDVVMIFLFIISLGCVVSHVYNARKARSAYAPAGAESDRTADSEAHLMTDPGPPYQARGAQEGKSQGVTREHHLGSY